MNTAFQGTHIKILFRADSEKLRDESLLSAVLLHIVENIRMQALFEPTVCNVKERLEELGVDNNFIDTGGLTGFVPISTSHVAMHTWPLECEAVLDVYSCKQFDRKIPMNIINEYYEPTFAKVSDLSQSLYQNEGNRLIDIIYRFEKTEIEV